MQHLNLFDASLRPERRWLNLPRLALAMSLLLALLWGASQWMAQRTRAQLERNAAAELQIRQLGQQAPAQAAAAQQQELDALRQRLAQARLFEVQLQSLPPSEAAPELLEALARAAGPEVWLTAAHWAAAEPRLELEGRLLDGRQLPAYLRRLEQQPAFKGQRFAQLSLGEPEAGGVQKFQLRSSSTSASGRAR
ncbi:PilN domain-containing protein [Inhella proteolytica]|uniref:PilN domain-containing protein n=1 Tax=Inhella proteolytica TaxID=2795029 RepID=A0A931NI63_9BURK|nr:PilN domain-containing protein [Inhella proteolytica]MBH9579001.1 PilN domain-containing protein [Inhella proteolytica]